MRRTITEWCRHVHQNAIEKGFYDGFDPKNPQHLLSRLMLIVSEAAEAGEVVRDGHGVVSWHRADGKPEGLGSELADIVIRTFDFAAALGIDLEAVIEEKAAFNAGRPRLHGKVT
jgi:NTP pyrophosphatase (non-canonical NTP hydrolase)